MGAFFLSKFLYLVLLIIYIEMLLLNIIGWQKMILVKEFNYENSWQRRIIYYNIFLTFFSISFLIADLALASSYYFSYFPIAKLILACLALGLSLGLFSGNFFFLLLKNSRPLYFTVDLLLGGGLTFYGGREFFLKFYDLHLSLFANPYFILSFVLFLFFLVGLKINYFFKISCGDFIDDKQGLLRSFSFLLLGTVLGILTSQSPNFFKLWTGLVIPSVGQWFLIFPFFLWISSFFINLPYNPLPLKVQQFESDQIADQGKLTNNFFLTYLNSIGFTFYSILTAASLEKFYGVSVSEKILFMGINFSFVFLGFLGGRIFRRNLVHFFLRMLLPVFFLIFLLILYYLADSLSLYSSVILFFPLSFSFGFSLAQTFKIIIANYSHQKRHKLVINFSFIFPLCFLALFSLINFTKAVYFLSVVFVLGSGLIFAIIFLFRLKTSLSKKIFLSFGPLATFILFFVFYSYANPVLTNSLYAEQMNNFDELQGITPQKLKSHKDFSFFRGETVIFRLSNSIIKNMERSLTPLFIYHPPQEKILFIDGNHKFFVNPLMTFFEKFLCLDPVRFKKVINSPLEFSEEGFDFFRNEPLMFFLSKNHDHFYSIVDIPNIFDLAKNSFRFSMEYYQMIKSRLIDKGLFVQIFNCHEIKNDFVIRSWESLEKVFPHQVAFLFSNFLVIISSEKKESLLIDENKYKRCNSFFKGETGLEQIIYNEQHLFSHLLAINFNDFMALWMSVQSQSPRPEGLLNQPSYFYAEKNNKILELFDSSLPEYLKKEIKDNLVNNEKILTLLKKAELAEAGNDYQKEATYIAELKKNSFRNKKLAQYLNLLSKEKEENYYSLALKLEESKNWEEAQNLYKAILIMNENNFEANYRLGLLCITLQNVDDSFFYMKKAMNLKEEHPEVLTQMGILFLSKKETDQAIDYLNRALRQEKNNFTISFYLGLAYEQELNFNQAEYYYNKALELNSDQTGLDVELRLENLKQKKEAFRNRWKLPPRKNQLEEEQDEDIPLPINKSAYDIRLKSTIRK